MSMIQNRTSVTAEIPVTLANGKKTSFFVQPSSRAQIPDTVKVDLSYLNQNENKVVMVDPKTGRPVDLKRMLKSESKEVAKAAAEVKTTNLTPKESA